MTLQDKSSCSVAGNMSFCNLPGREQSSPAFHEACPTIPTSVPALSILVWDILLHVLEYSLESMTEPFS